MHPGDPSLLDAWRTTPYVACTHCCSKGFRYWNDVLIALSLSFLNAQ